MKIALRAHWWDTWGLCRSPCTNATKNLKHASVLLNKNLCVITEEQKALSSAWGLSEQRKPRFSRELSALRHPPVTVTLHLLTFPHLLKHSIYPYLLLVTLTHFSFLNCIFRKKFSFLSKNFFLPFIFVNPFTIWIIYWLINHYLLFLFYCSLKFSKFTASHITLNPFHSDRQLCFFSSVFIVAWCVAFCALHLIR